MLKFLDNLTTEIRREREMLEYENSLTEEEYNKISEYASNGVPIQDERWEQLEDKFEIYVSKILALESVEKSILLYKNPRNSGKDPQFFIDLIERQHLKFYCKFEEYECCALLKKLITNSLLRLENKYYFSDYSSVFSR